MCFVLPSWLAAECQTQGLCVYKDNIKENLSHYHNKRKPQIWPSLALTAVKLWCSYGEVLAATCLLFMCDLLANIFSNTSTHLFPSSVRSNFISPSGALAVNIMSPSVVVPEMSFCYWSDFVVINGTDMTEKHCSNQTSSPSWREGLLQVCCIRLQ